MTTNNTISPSRKSSTAFSKHSSTTGIFSRALSSLSKPVEEWGVSDVPVLSVQVTPRRQKVSPARRKGGGNERESGSPRGRHTGTARGLDKGVLEARERVRSLRPLSVATVSTFGSWMVGVQFEEEEEEGGDINHAENGLEPAHLTHVDEETTPYHDETMSARDAKVQGTIDSSVDTSSSSLHSPSHETTSPTRRGITHPYHPLRMHPPSSSNSSLPPTSLPLLAHHLPALPAQNNTLQPSTSSYLLSPSPSISTLNDTASKSSSSSSSTSKKTINSRRSHASLSPLDTVIANTETTPHEESVAQVSEFATGDIDAGNIGAGNITAGRVDARAIDPQDVRPGPSFPRDKGYVDALRAWYEEKEKENHAVDYKGVVREGKEGAGKTRAKGRVRGTKRVEECVFASLGANQRL